MCQMIFSKTMYTLHTKSWCIVLFITKNHTVHRFNVCTRNIIQIENHEYIYQIIAVRDSVPITYLHKSNFHVGTTY